MDTSEPFFEFPFQDSGLSLDARVDDLVSRLTLEEKIALLHQRQPAIPRLGIAAFTTGLEVIHGVAWLGEATVYPQAIGLASTWDTDLMQRVGSAVGDEARGFHVKTNGVSHLNVWSPVVDLLRDPRAGRNEEGYSEDPYLTGQMSIAFCSGLVGDDPFYLKTAPSLKHFFAYNNEEKRDVSNSNVTPRNLHEYYLKAFQPAIAAGKATGVMTSYNLVNGRPNTVSPYLNSMIRQWTPQTLMIVSDSFGPSNIAGSQQYYATHPESHAAAIKAGLDSFTDKNEDSSFTIEAVHAALSQGLLEEADIDNAVRHIFSIRIRLGEFDPDNPYSDITEHVINVPEHRDLARRAAQEQMVLLKNEGDILPLDTSAIKTIAVIGQRADQVLTDWYSGTLPYTISPLAAIRDKVGAGVSVHYAADNANGAAVDIARSADVAIVVLGNHPTCSAGWAQCPDQTEGKEAVDRQAIYLPTEGLIQEVYGANPRTIVVLVSSFPYTITWTDRNVPAILWSSHGGQELGSALADVLFGDYAPAGRLTETWYASLDGLPSILEYDIIKYNRTYQYYTGIPLYPFGHGLTYTTFRYGNLSLSTSSLSSAGEVEVSIDVTNTGPRDSEEVVQLYVHARQSRVKRPIKQLKAFARVRVNAGQTETVHFTLPAAELAIWDVTRERWVVELGVYDILIGRSSADIQLVAAVTVDGETIPSRNLRLLTRAECFDDYHGACLVDETRPSGTAVAAGSGDWIAFQDVDFGGWASQFVASVANEGASAASLEIRLDSPDGTLIGTIQAPVTGSRYDWTMTAAPVSGATGVHDVYLVFGGAMRIRMFQFLG